MDCVNRLSSGCTEGSGVLCCRWMLHVSRMGAGLMDGPRLVISQTSEQDAGGGLWGP